MPDKTQPDEGSENIWNLESQGFCHQIEFQWGQVKFEVRRKDEIALSFVTNPGNIPFSATINYKEYELLIPQLKSALTFDEFKEVFIGCLTENVYHYIDIAGVFVGGGRSKRIAGIYINCMTLDVTLESLAEKLVP